MMTGEKVFLFILASVITSLSGCILIEDTTKVSQYELRRQHFEKYYGNDKDETFKKSMTREPAFDSIRRAGNRDSPPNPVPIEPPGL